MRFWEGGNCVVSCSDCWWMPYAHMLLIGMLQKYSSHSLGFQTKQNIKWNCFDWASELIPIKDTLRWKLLLFFFVKAARCRDTRNFVWVPVEISGSSSMILWTTDFIQVFINQKCFKLWHFVGVFWVQRFFAGRFCYFEKLMQKLMDPKLINFAIVDTPNWVILGELVKLGIAS